MVEGEAAPLYAANGVTTPPGQAEWFEGSDGLRLRAALFPAENPRGSVVLSGGRTEFIEKYLEVIGEFVGRGFTVLTHDWRGQGLSA
jgi:lysophospholipase